MLASNCFVAAEFRSARCEGTCSLWLPHKHLWSSSVWSNIPPGRSQRLLVFNVRTERRLFFSNISNGTLLCSLECNAVLYRGTKSYLWRIQSGSISIREPWDKYERTGQEEGFRAFHKSSKKIIPNIPCFHLSLTEIISTSGYLLISSHAKQTSTFFNSPSPLFVSFIFSPFLKTKFWQLWTADIDQKRSAWNLDDQKSPRQKTCHTKVPC